MADQIWRPVGVITHPAGTLLQYDNGSDTSIYFYDANHNQRLDAGDKKILETDKGNDRFELSASRVTADDLGRFGPEAERLFTEGLREREKLRHTIPPQKTGKCYFPLEGKQLQVATIEGVEFHFKPPLSLRSARVPQEKLYRLIDLLQLNSKSPTVDPTRCFKAQANLPRTEVLGRRLDPPSITLSTPDIEIIPALIFLNLKNGPELDASFTLQNGMERFHLDLSR